MNALTPKQSISPPRITRAQRNALQRLQLLCEAETGLEPIAASASIAVRDLISAASTSIFWMDAEGQPAGFFHDCAPAEIKDLFVSHLESLFSAPDEPNMVSLIRSSGDPVGQLLGDDAINAAARSNVWKYLCAPLGHYYALDIRIERNRHGCALICLWNPPGSPFGDRDAALADTARSLLNAAAAVDDSRDQWRPDSSGLPHLITDIAGVHLVAIDPVAETLLRESHLLRQGIPMAGNLRDAPFFCRQLSAMIDAGQPPELHFACAAGRIALRASRSHRLDDPQDNAGQMLVVVTLERSRIVSAIETIFALPLTFLQKRIALFAIRGGARSDCEARFAVGPEALKKHLRAVYAETGCRDWVSLQKAFWL